MAAEPQAAPLEFTLAAAAKFFSVTEQELTTLSRRGSIPRIKNGQLPWIETTQRYIKHLSSPFVTLDDGGELLGKSAQWIRKLIAEGYIEREHRGGMVRRDDVFLGYIRFLTDDERRSRKNESENRVRDARAREIELRMAERLGALTPTETYDQFTDVVCGAYRAELSGLPSRFTRDLVQRRALDQEIHGLLERVANLVEAARLRIGSGGGADSSIASDDAEQVGDAESDLSAIGVDSGSA